MARRTKDEAMKTREDILDAALDVMSEKGYSRMTFVDIAERIGLTKGAVYWHFKNKKSLLIELIKEFHDRRERLVAENARQLNTFDDLLEHFVQRTHVVMQDPSCRKIAFFLSFQMEWTQDLLEAANESLNELRKDLFLQVVEVIKDAKDAGMLKKEVEPRESAVILISLWKGLFANDVGGYADMDLLKCVEKSFSWILEGMKA
ncbi:MAG: TetR family transcriptional regulator [Sedimentisphaeraceae bacterium JB056]